MSNYNGAGQNYQYVLPFQNDAVPSSFKSCLAPKPINCNLQTVVIPSTSGNSGLGTTGIIQVPLGQSAYICNPYLRFKVVYTGVNAESFKFKGAAGGASALISSYQTSINSTLIDNIQNYGLGIMEPILAHSSSNDWLNKDGGVLMNTPHLTSTLGAAGLTEVYCIPLIGLLGSQQSFPAWAINGILQINVNYVSTLTAALTTSGAASVTAVSFQELSLVYDRVAVESDFISRMKGEMASSGAQYCYGFTNYQSLTAVSTNGQNTINTGLNVSSLRGVVMTSVLSTDSTTLTADGYSLRNGLSNFQVTLDGRLINSSILDAVNQPAAVFVELQKCFSRVFDSNVTDISAKDTYLTQSFAAGVSCNRVSEGLSFAGSPCSVLGLQITQTAATFTNFIMYISDYQLLIGANGDVSLVR